MTNNINAKEARTLTEKFDTVEYHFDKVMANIREVAAMGIDSMYCGELATMFIDDADFGSKTLLPSESSSYMQLYHKINNLGFEIIEPKAPHFACKDAHRIKW